ncbi:hypothetical protein PHISP_08646, partial [Aspergillus sp. HF37]
NLSGGDPGPCDPGYSLRDHHRHRDTGGVRSVAEPRGGQPGGQSAHDLLQGDDAADPARRGVGGVVRLRHVVRRGRGGAVHRRSRSADHSAPD